jgi:hypothetical protein
MKKRAALLLWIALLFCAGSAQAQTLLQKIPVAFAGATQARLFSNDKGDKHVLLAFQPSKKLLTCIELGEEFNLLRPAAAALNFPITGLEVQDVVIGADSVWVYLSTTAQQKPNLLLFMAVTFDLTKGTAAATLLNPAMATTEFLGGHTRGDLFWLLGIGANSSTIRLYGYKGTAKVAEERLELGAWVRAAPPSSNPNQNSMHALLQPDYSGSLRQNVYLAPQLRAWDNAGSLNETTVPFQIFVQPERWVFTWNDFRSGHTRIATLDAKLFLSQTAALPAPALSKRAAAITQFHATVWGDHLFQVANSGQRLVMGVYDFVKDTIRAVYNYTPGLTQWPFARRPMYEIKEGINGADYFSRDRNDLFFSQTRDTVKTHEAYIGRVYKAGLSLAAQPNAYGQVALRLGYFKDLRSEQSPIGLGIGPIGLNIPTGPPALFGYTECLLNNPLMTPAEVNLTITPRAKAQQFYANLLRGRGEAADGYPVALGYKPDIAFHFPLADGRHVLGFYDKRDKQLYFLAFR